MSEADINLSWKMYNVCDVYSVFTSVAKIGALVIAVVIVVEVTPIILTNLQGLSYYVKTFGVVKGFEMYKTLGISNLPNGVISWLQMDMADGDSSLDDMGTLAKYGDEFGKMGTYVEKPAINIDWTQCTQHGIERMNQRGMTKEIVDSIVANGKALSQCYGSKFAFITKEGVAIVSKEGRLVTAWSSANFDENMLEIIKRLFGK